MARLRSRVHDVSPEGGSLWLEGCVKQVDFEQVVKQRGGYMGDESSESTEEDEVTGQEDQSQRWRV